MKQPKQEELEEKYDFIYDDDILYIKERFKVTKAQAIMIYLMNEQLDFLVRIDNILHDIDHKLDKIENQLY